MLWSRTPTAAEQPPSLQTHTALLHCSCLCSYLLLYDEPGVQEYKTVSRSCSIPETSDSLTHPSARFHLLFR